jgi:hypothetical protein
MDIKYEHFKKAAKEIGSHGDNDTLPFDIDNKFISDKHAEIAELAFEFYERSTINKTPMITSSQKNSFVIYYDGCLYNSFSF